MSETPRTDGRVCKCLDLEPIDACEEHVELCRTLERELAAMTAAKELAERQITRIQDERAASFGRLNDAVGGTGMTAHQPEIDLLIEAAIKGIIKQKELAERQVAVLLHLASKRPCADCPAFSSCNITIAQCYENMAAWSRAEAERGKG